MTAYCQDDYCTIYHGDCLDVLPGIHATRCITENECMVQFAKKKPNR